MNAPLRTGWTQEQFFAWAERQAERTEFDGVAPVAMTGGTVGHALIVQNLHGALRTRLQGSGCQPLGPDAGIETIGQAVRYPDAVVTCAPLDPDARTVPAPVVVFEVLSAGTSRVDRIVKVREYAAVPSIRRYVILEATSVGLTVLARPDGDLPWSATTLTRGDTLAVPELGIAIPVASFYDGLALPDDDA